MMTNKSAYDVATTFPDQKATVKRVIKEKKRELGDLLAIERSVKEKCSKNIRNYYRCVFQTLHFDGIYNKKARLERHIAFNEKVLRIMELKEKGGDNPSWVDALVAKDRPITDFIDFSRAGFASCIWHNEETPSMKYYFKNNRVHCFGCQRNGDVIDVVMKLYNFDFKQALSFVVRGPKS